MICSCWSSRYSFCGFSEQENSNQSSAENGDNQKKVVKEGKQLQVCFDLCGCTLWHILLSLSLYVVVNIVQTSKLSTEDAYQKLLIVGVCIISHDYFDVHIQSFLVRNENDSQEELAEVMLPVGTVLYSQMYLFQ